MSRFFHFYFQGGRYDLRQGVPLAVLPNLTKVEALVRSVARDLFLDANSDRHRVSPGFDDAFEPALTTVVGGGSATAEVGWSPPPDDPSSQYFEAAQTEIVDLVEVFGDPEPKPPPWLSRESMAALAEVLAALATDEQVTWSTADKAMSATADHAVLLRVRDGASRVFQSRDERFSVVGRLIGYREDPWTVLVTNWETKRVVAVPTAARFKPGILEALAQNDTTLVRLEGQAVRDIEGARRLVETDGIGVVRGPPLTARVEALAKVEQGWLGEDEGPSLVPTRRFLVHVERELWSAIEALGIDRPHLFLRPDGGVDALWKTPSRTITLKFAASSVYGMMVDRAARTTTRSDSATKLGQLHGWLREHWQGRR